MLRLEDATVVAGVQLTPAQIKLGEDAAAADSGVKLDIEAVYTDRLRATSRHPV